MTTHIRHLIATERALVILSGRLMSAYATEFAQEGSLMATSTPTTTRTAHLLDLMKQGDDAFNNRDVAAMDAIHHLDMIAHVTGSAEPIYGSDDDNA